MVRLVLLAVLLMLLAWAFWRVMDGVIAAMGGSPGGRRAQPPGVKLVRDPVCGTYVAARAALSLTRGSTTHYFCSERCRGEFTRRR
jgi:YHS domain-containing protein